MPRTRKDTRSPEELAELRPFWAELERIRSEKLRHTAGSAERHRLLRRQRELTDQCYAIAQKYR